MSTPARSRWTASGAGLAAGALAGLIAKDLNLFGLLSYWGDAAPWVVGMALLGGTAGATRLRWVFALAASALGLLWLAIAFTPLCAWLARDLPRRDALQRAEAVYVLGSNIQSDGELTTEAMSRLVHALELVHEEWAPRLILPELYPPMPSYAEPARALMRNLGLSQEVVSVGPTHNTHDEAVAVAALVRRRGWKRLLLVTAPSHSRRAAAAFERAGVTVVSSPSVQTLFDLESLDEPDERLRAFAFLAHEWAGLWVYRRRGWID